MASKGLNGSNRGKELTESLRVNVPFDHSDFSVLRKPRNHCNHMSDCFSSRSLIQNYSNFKRSGSPARFMFFQDGSWVDFPSPVIETIRSAFLDRNPVIDVRIDGSKYLFDFLRMVQIDFETENQRSISWIDEDGKCFFPKVFVDEVVPNCMENSEHSKIEVEIIDGAPRKRKRAVSELNEDTEVNSTNQCGHEDVLKRHREVTMELETCRWPNSKALIAGDKNYVSISSLFLSTITKFDPSVTITAIHQCMRTGPLERARFDVFQKQNELTRAARGNSNMVCAWYGSSRKAVGDILLHGFGEPSKVPASDSFGTGVYLSPVASPHKSVFLSEADENGEKHILLCRAILGSVEKVEAGSQQSHPSSVDFDSGVDDLTNPKWYVVWCTNMSRHILPECVVSYRSSNHLSGQIKGSTDATNFPAGLLLSKMKTCLPHTKCQEVKTLFETFKAGKFAKDYLVKKLRSIIGDETLLAMIREIRG